MSLDEVSYVFASNLCTEKLANQSFYIWQKFNKAAEDIKGLTARPTDDELKEIYALFKQATVGDVNTPRPGMLDFKGKAKWDAWESKKSMSSDAAKEAYILKAAELVAKYSAWSVQVLATGERHWFLMQQSNFACFISLMLWTDWCSVLLHTEICCWKIHPKKITIINTMALIVLLDVS